MKSITLIAVLAIFLFAESRADSSIDCVVSGTGEGIAVSVSIQSPHAGEMVVTTPDGRMIWLQADHIPFVFPVTDDFEQLSGFILDTQSRGSWFNEWGEPEAVPVFSIDGEYEIRIAENIESRRDDAYSLSCKFSVTMNDSAKKN